MRGRFAPSPTGELHLGNVFAALLGYLHARSNGGAFLLRIEDLDRARCKPEFTGQMEEDLHFLGLRFEGERLVQSERGEVYRAALSTLEQVGQVYPCFCTRQEIARAASAPHGASDEGPVYPGTCAGLSLAQRAERARTRPPAFRFRPREGTVSFVDARAGEVSQDVRREVGDFVVFRNDGVASYQLAVVVDDAASAITHVVRGDDLLSSTPRQLLLHEALGRTPPAYLHTPLLLGPDGKRLAKREGSLSIAELRRRQVPAERLVAVLGQLAGLRGSNLEELAKGFAPGLLPKGAITVDEAVLRSALG